MNKFILIVDGKETIMGYTEGDFLEIRLETTPEEPVSDMELDTGENRVVLKLERIEDKPKN